MTVPPAPSPSPFDPAGVPWVPVSPRLVTVRLISVGVWLGVPLVVTAAVAAGPMPAKMPNARSTDARQR